MVQPESTVGKLVGIPEAFKDKALQAESPELGALIQAQVKPQKYSMQQEVLIHKLLGQTKPRVVLLARLFDMYFHYYHKLPSTAHMEIKKTLALFSPTFGPRA